MSVRMVPGTAGVGGAVLGGAVLGVTTIALLAGPADAHNVLEKQTPAAGSTVATVPATVELVFNTTVLGIGTGVKVTGPAGDIQDGKPVVVDNTVRQPLRAGSPAGKYTVAWRVTSVDGHPISDSWTFMARAASAGGATTAAVTAAPTTSAPTTAAAAADDGTKQPGEDTSWTKILIGGALGAAIGLGYVLVQRNRRSRKCDAPTAAEETS